MQMTKIFNTGVRPLITDYLRKKGEEERDYGDYWSASSAGYCMRLNLLKRLKVPPVPEIEEDKDRTTRVFEAGHIFHEWIQRITKDAGISIAQEVELQDEELMIRGHFDDLVLVPVAPKPPQVYIDGGQALPPKHLILYDYKTAHSVSFNYKKGQPMGHYHKMQLGTYMYMMRGKQWTDGVWNKPNFQWSPREDLLEARILTISKDDLRMDETQLFWTPELEKEVYSYWATLNGCWKSKTLPKCTCLDHDGGFMGKRSKKGKVYNPYFYNDEPCSLEWYNKCKKEGLV